MKETNDKIRDGEKSKDGKKNGQQREKWSQRRNKKDGFVEKRERERDTNNTNMAQRLNSRTNLPEVTPSSCHLSLRETTPLIMQISSFSYLELIRFFFFTWFSMGKASLFGNSL